MKTIVVNNPAAQSGGALTILKQFIENISKYDKENKYIIFVTLNDLKNYENEQIKIIVLDEVKGYKRLYWDYFGLKKWCEKNRVSPNLLISLQNTGVFYKKIPQVIYEHQSLIFSEENWSLLKKDERAYWFYKNIYPFFIKITVSKNTTIVVQTEWMKEKFEKMLKNKKYSSIEVCSPEINLSNFKIKEEKIDMDETKINLFYPASSELLKNHKLLIEVMKSIKKETPDVAEKINMIFTFNKEAKKDLYLEIQKEELENNFKFIGSISYNKVINYYMKIDALVFPSHIESFPLPLIEGSSLGLKILVSDLPYSKYLKSYEGAIHIENSSIENWKKEILLLLKIKGNKYIKNNYQNKNGWDKLFEKINSI